MQLIRGLSRWPDHKGTVITIGNFDGVHLGHQAMFKTTREIADAHTLLASVVSFEPLPHEYFAAGNAPPRLQGLRDKVNSIEQAGIERLLLMHFDHNLAEMSAEQFIDDVLIKRLNTKHLIIGDDFRFGHQRQGNFNTLQNAGANHGFTVQKSETYLHEDKRISSTRVRASLINGELGKVSELLGRLYRISGRIIHGEKIGRKLGFPTANVALGSHNPPLRGVFAVWANHLESGTRYPAVANLGERPTIGGRKLLLEVHAMNENPDWYGAHLAVDFIARLRPEKQFGSLDELKTQITQDARDASKLINAL